MIVHQFFQRQKKHEFIKIIQLKSKNVVNLIRMSMKNLNWETLTKLKHWAYVVTSFTTQSLEEQGPNSDH